MELSFSELRAKEVINTQDGRKLGRVCDIILCYPENKWIGIIVPNGRGFGKKNELFIELRNIVKIGEDVILVNAGMPRRQNCNKHGHGMPISPSQSPHGGGCDPYSSGGGAPYTARNYEEFE